ncbi:hypothetical protein BG015_001591 [Linnemannia schmuckeri]|uniref:Chromo domain-containing protein n=1 Tax=Linnemannia schmuckeri TaxID=64567 RepID=A0A9P5RRL9_9FUNG|nr:hypothetical protein BG015_001591 [Linnemannia schmuckeri]
MTDAFASEAAASKKPSVPLKEHKSDEANKKEEVNQRNTSTSIITSDKIMSNMGDRDNTEDKSEVKAENKLKEKSESKADGTDKATAGSKVNDDHDTDDKEDPGEAEYEVERVVGHKHTKGRLQYYLKWNGYDSDENTWEDRENVYCVDLIEAYWMRLEQAGGSRTDSKGKDGVPVKKEPTRTAKSNGAKTTKKDRDGDTMTDMTHVKRQKTSNASKGVKKAEDGSEGGASSNNYSNNNITINSSGWTPPKSWTSWEEKVESILTVERSNQKLLIRLQWNNGRETQHPIEVAHQKCPQKLIQFYESHIKFSQA